MNGTYTKITYKLLLLNIKCLHHDLDKQMVSKAKLGLFQKSCRETNAMGVQKETEIKEIH